MAVRRVTGRRAFAAAAAAKDAAKTAPAEEAKVWEVVDEIALRELMMDKTRPGTLIVDCHADWCGPCRKLGPVLEAEVLKRDGVRLAKLNVDEFDRVPQLLKVTAIPAVFAFRGGEAIANFVGCPSATDVATWVENVANYDPKEHD